MPSAKMKLPSLNTVLKIAGGLFVILIVIQLVPSKSNNGEVYGANDITHVVAVPDSVKKILEPACFDCHSNHTNYIWYSNVQPVGFWIEHHINEGREELNFSEYKTYKAKRKTRKMQGIVKQLKKGDMPLNSYTWMHPEARLTDAQRQTLIAWAEGAVSALPVDSTSAKTK
jgi:hypothetical protein